MPQTATLSSFIKRLKKTTGMLAIFFCVSMMACESKKVQEKNEKYYYDLKGFIENQIVYLGEKKPSVSKMAVLNGKAESARVSSIDWKKELELFVQADINKPANRLSYEVLQKGPIEYEYKLRPEMHLPVQYLKVVVDSTVNQPVYIKAMLSSENKIYNSEKHIELNCVKNNNLWQISSFSVSGYQKLIFMDKKSFQITSKIGL